MEHQLRSNSSFIRVILSSLKHKACVRCGYPIHSLEEAEKHWESELERTKKRTGRRTGYRLGENYEKEIS